MYAMLVLLIINQNNNKRLTFFYRVRSWARRTPTFRFNDSFVLEHPQYYRFL